MEGNNVDHPQHYNQAGIECIDALKAATINKPPFEAVCVANAIKYLWRYEDKNGLEDVQKAEWYIRRLLKELEDKVVRDSVKNEVIGDESDTTKGTEQ